MKKPLLILDQHPRSVEELFSGEAFVALGSLCRVKGGRDGPMPASELDRLIETADFVVAARPSLDAARVAGARNLRAVIEVSGAFHAELDYAACFDRDIEVLSCAPAFKKAVAEMGLTMILAAARGLVAEHEAFRSGVELWRDDREDRDVSLFGQAIGFVGYGNIAKELHRLLQPFAPRITAYDPWLKAFPDEVEPVDIETLFAHNRVVVVTAVPSSDNRGLVSESLIRTLPTGAHLILLSRAHCIDFSAALQAARAGRITFAMDVFPTEPVGLDDPLRTCPNVILSPHRAAAVKGGRQPIGDMILHDVKAILSGNHGRELLPAEPSRVAVLIAGQRQIESDGRR
ncbi:MAG: hydroxyacid dehydrogenase [Hyphomicrobiales bacterium]|nr:hydroxyacid dehydrogenase [Hyphomicrobiales bacterium]